MNLYLKKNPLRIQDANERQEIARKARDGVLERSPQSFYKNATVTPPVSPSTTTLDNALSSYLSLSKRRFGEITSRMSETSIFFFFFFFLMFFFFFSFVIRRRHS
jgi:hypothetical protein